MAVRSGSDIFLKLATQLVNATTSQSIELPVDMIDVTTKDSTGKAKEYIAGELGGTLSCEGKWNEGTSDYTLQEILAARAAGTELAFIWGGVSNGSVIITGQCLISNFSASAPKNAEATWTMALQITGVISVSTAT
jgi:predicted secreted protein